MNKNIYKVLSPHEWEQASKSGLIECDVDKEDGFVHLSTSAQLNGTLSLYFKSYEQVVLLKINSKKLIKDIVFELPSEGSKRKTPFPHYYADLTLECIEQIWHLERGAFILPDETLLEAENSY